MRTNNIIYVKGLTFDELKHLLNDSLSYQSIDMVIYHTDNPKHHVVCFPENRKPCEFIDDFTDIVESDELKGGRLFGWFIADENIMRATSGASYMLTNVVAGDGDCPPLLVDKNGNCYLNYIDDCTDEGEKLYQEEDEAYIDAKGVDNCTCLHRTNAYKAKYIPCKLPKLTTSETYRPQNAFDDDKGDSSKKDIFDKLLVFFGLERLENFLNKHLGFIGLLISLCLKVFIFLSMYIGIMLMMFDGYDDFSDTIKDFNFSLFDCIFFGVCAGIVVTVIRQKGIQFTKDYVDVLISDIIYVYIAAGILMFAVFTTNKVVGKSEYKEIRAEIINCEEMSGKNDYNELTFTIPISSAVYTRHIDIEDKSYFNCDSCTVVYHHGCLGLDVIDKIKH